MNKIATFLGLDISKNKIDCCLMSNGKYKHFVIENSLDGFNNLLIKIEKENINLTELYACCEATNIYYLAVSRFLYEQKVLISVVNPAIIKHFAEYQLKRVKTDKQDAKLIAQFCQKEQPKLWQPEREEQVKLKSLYRRIEQLQQIQTMEKNRLAVADDVTKMSIEMILKILTVQIDECRKQIQNIIDEHHDLKQKQEILQTITGIGKSTAQILLIIMMDIERFPTARHLVSWLGLSPIIKNSGKSKGKSVISKMGNRLIRKALYMPARSACTRSKLWRSWFEKKVKSGKHPKQVYVLMMVKLIKYAYVCIKNNEPFEVSRHQDVGAEAMGV